VFPIPGSRNPLHVEENVAALEFSKTLTAEEIAELEAAVPAAQVWTLNPDPDPNLALSSLMPVIRRDLPCVHIDRKRGADARAAQQTGLRWLNSLVCLVPSSALLHRLPCPPSVTACAGNDT